MHGKAQGHGDGRSVDTADQAGAKAPRRREQTDILRDDCGVDIWLCAPLPVLPGSGTIDAECGPKRLRQKRRIDRPI
jgi:hypothetical protein